MARVRSVLLYEVSAAARKPALLFILLATHAASAAVYPVSARLTLAPKESQHCLSLPSGTDCAIVEIARAAFADKIALLFAASATPDLQLVLTVKSAELSRVSTVALDLVVHVRILGPGGELIDELKASGSGDLLALENAGLEEAKQVAAREAAASFERAYASSPKVGKYLVANKIAPAPAASSAPVYPVSVRLLAAPRENQHCLVLSGDTDCRVVRKAKEAFDATVSRLFKTSTTPDLQLVLTVKNADFSRVSSPRLDLVVRVRVLTPGGEDLDEIEAFGHADMLDTDDAAMTRAEQLASAEAARDFEHKYADSSKVGNYLVTKKVAPASAVGVSERSDKLITVGGGAGFVQGGGDDNFAFAPSLRVMGSLRWLMLQAVYSHYTSSFTGTFSNITQSADLTTNDLGLEAGAVVRFTPTIELHAGPGLHYFFGDASVGFPAGAPSFSFAKVAPTLFASLQTSIFLARNAPRLVAGVEAHAYFFTTVDLPELSRTVPAANTSFGLFVGLEWPWKAKEGRAQ
jgi:hypothetical protein